MKDTITAAAGLLGVILLAATLVQGVMSWRFMSESDEFKQMLKDEQYAYYDELGTDKITMASEQIRLTKIIKVKSYALHGAVGGALLFFVSYVNMKKKENG
ncbi:hypothetical protein [Rubritalea profundi]|uniref:Uncharacterized protein n=1 Tax=Rubritalea profundi TaxID=1658618 RepID=A0A2S7TXF0_9BACT|nr:hypothetical protein [Rubritalea profundi]PQJ27435.1 hypothetical protein BSZ32_02275 [Rubritalea profundi]